MVKILGEGGGLATASCEQVWVVDWSMGNGNGKTKR
jgi:hypothetical protein